MCEGRARGFTQLQPHGLCAATGTYDAAYADVALAPAVAAAAVAATAAAAATAVIAGVPRLWRAASWAWAKSTAALSA